MEIDVTQRWRSRRALYRPAGEIIDARRMAVAPIPDDVTAKAFVLEHHYDGTYPAARFRFGLYERHELVGVAVFSHPTNPLALKPLPGSELENVELGRFVLLDRVAGNGESWFLARAFEALRRESILGVVSFSDPVARTTAAGATIFRGHLGTIYQAHNACFLGRSRPDHVRLLPDGSVLHNRAVAKVRASERGGRNVVARLVDLGADAAGAKEDPIRWLECWLPRLTRRVPHAGKFKYAWGLNARVRRGLPRSQPYPKFRSSQLDLVAT